MLRVFRLGSGWVGGKRWVNNERAETDDQRWQRRMISSSEGKTTQQDLVRVSTILLPHCMVEEHELSEGSRYVASKYYYYLLLSSFLRMCWISSLPTLPTSPCLISAQRRIDFILRYGCLSRIFCFFRLSLKFRAWPTSHLLPWNPPAQEFVTTCGN